MLEHLYLNSFIELSINMSLLRYYSQSFLVSLLYTKPHPSWFDDKGYDKDSNGNLVTDKLINFVNIQKNSNDSFNGIIPNSYIVKSKLAHKSFIDNPSKTLMCELECASFSPDENLLNLINLPFKGKHIVYFTGVNICYQQFFRDITSAAKETGATFHAFNYPGISESTGCIREANDLINAGLAMVNNLLEQGIDLNDIILLGDCNGAAVAFDVKRIIEQDIKEKRLITILNNAYSSINGIIFNIINNYLIFFSDLLYSFIEFLTEYTGWYLSPRNKKNNYGDDYYNGIEKDRCHIFHIGDKALRKFSLADEDFPETQDAEINNLYKLCKVQVKESCKQKHAAKQNKDVNDIDTHLIPLCDMELSDGSHSSVYEGFVNPFLKMSYR